MIGGFRSVLCVSVFQSSFPVIVIMTDGSEKRICGGGFWTSMLACFWKAERSNLTKKLLHYDDKITVSCSTNMFPEHFFQAWHQMLQTTKINLKKSVSLIFFFSKITVAIRFNLPQVCPSMPAFILYSLCCTLSLCFELRLCLCSTQFGVSSSCDP